ncbi:helix-turn-helix domain-containing protein [Actinomadura fulvescens]|uniref:Helix-turn-helix domain-containing protein n=1 Tax=Actinomadura fulvescens TaxID=46160 RepID=A0ABP6C4F9_9ACTN
MPHLVEFGTGHLPPAERLDFWLDLVFQSHVRSWIKTEAEGDFTASTLSLDLGTVVVSVLTNPSIRGDRTAKLIRQCDPEVILVHLPLNSSGSVSQGKHHNAFSPGDVVLYDSSRPLRVQQNALNGVSRWILVEIPRATLEQLVPSVSSLIAVPGRATDGIGAVLTRYLDELLRNARDYTLAERTALNGVTVDLVAATCARLRAGHVPPETHRQVLFVHIRDFIDRRLGDPALTPQAIAAAHHISVRQLHKLFQLQGGPSVAAWIRIRRLERCRRDFADPRLGHLAVCVIARRWGFTDPAHFGRIFRETYGVTPTDYRHRHSDVP